MYREKDESLHYPEGDNRLEELQEEHRQILTNITEEALKSQTNLLGKGLTAEVHHLKERPHVCIKIISYDTIDWDKRPKFSSLLKEAQFLDKARVIQGQVGLPRPYFSAVLEDDAEREVEEDNVELQIMVMERLNAVSIRDILENKAQLPQVFDIDSFFKKLKNFIDQMHDELRLYHRDLHDGNVMVDAQGKPYIIDFGSAIYGFADENVYRQDDPISGLIKYTTDEANLDITKQKLLEHISLTT